MVEFDKEKHQYKKNGKIYTSVTTVISKYKNPFDPQYWAIYKACKDVISAAGEVGWSRYKRAAGGWEGVVAHFKKNGHSLHKEIAVRKAEYLHAWDVKGHNARTVGTAVHAWKEKAIIGSKALASSTSGEMVNIHVSQDALLRAQDFTGNRLFAEIIISNDEYEVAGMADRVEKYEKIIHIKDYKTSAKIEKIAFQDKKMKHPLEELPDCNYYHYMMQFSFYAWMFAQMGYEIGTLELQHLLPPRFEDKDMVPYKMEYRPDLVEKMLKDFRKR